MIVARITRCAQQVDYKRATASADTATSASARKNISIREKRAHNVYVPLFRLCVFAVRCDGWGEDCQPSSAVDVIASACGVLELE